MSSNPCYICVSNKITNDKQHAFPWHAEDTQTSHVDSKINDKPREWAEKKYESDELGHVVVTRGEHMTM